MPTWCCKSGSTRARSFGVFTATLWQSSHVSAGVSRAAHQHVPEVTEVQAGVSRKTTYDAKGAPIPPAPPSPQARTITTEEALRSLQTML